MKIRISATIDEKSEKFLSLLIKNGRYRNKSHIIEEAISLLWREHENKDKKG